MAYRQASPFVDQFFDTNGLPLSGGTIKSYLSGTTTATAMYTDGSGTSAGSSITLNVRGEPEVSGNTVNIWLDEAITYKFVLADSSGTSIWTADGINIGFAGGSIDIQGTNPLINFKTGASESFDTRIAQITNGLGFYTGGNAQTVLGMLLDQNRNLLLDPAGAGGAPAAPLHVKGATANYPIKVESTDGTAGVQLSDNATNVVVGLAAIGDNAILKGSKVGIGIESPSHTFDVYANADNQYVAQFSQDHATGWGVLIDTDGTSNDDPALWVKNASNTILWAAQSGKIGAGTDSPADEFHVNASKSGGDVVLRIQNSAVTTGDTATLRFCVTSDVNHDSAFIGSDRSNSLIFGADLQERARIDASGNLLVDTTDINATGGGFSFRAGSINYMNIAHDSSVESGNFFVAFKHGSSTIGTISQNGTTGVLYNTSSDERLKENITDSGNAGSKIDAIRIRQYDWKADGTHQDYGVIAQELVKVAPEAVHQPIDEEDMMGVDYSKLVPMLVKEIQSLRNRVAQLEKN